MSGRSGPRASASARPSSWVREMVDASALFTCVRQRFVRLASTGRSRGPQGQDAPGQAGDAAACLDGVTLHRAAEMDGIEIDTLQATGTAGPQRLVRFGAPEHVELIGTLADRRFDCEGHQRQADALRGVGLVVAVLVEVE